MTAATRPAPVTHFLLPGQAAAPEGPVDMNGMYVLHHALRRDLGRFAGAVGPTPLSDVATWRLLRERWQRFADELHVHHSKEDDVLWPLLEARAAANDDREALDTLAEMEAEHGLLDPLLAECGAGFARLAETPDEETQTRLEVDLGRLRTVLGEHLAHEETTAIPLVHQYLGAEEWAEIERTRFRAKLGLRQALLMVPWIFDGLPAEPSAALRRQAGPPFAVMLALTRRGHARREARTFRYLPAAG